MGYHGKDGWTPCGNTGMEHPNIGYSQAPRAGGEGELKTGMECVCTQKLSTGSKWQDQCQTRGLSSAVDLKDHARIPGLR